MDDDDGTRGEHRRGYEQQRKSTLATLSACLFVYLFVQAMADDEEDGGDDDGMRGQHIHRRRKYIGYTTWLLLLFFCCCYRFVVSHMLAMAEGQR